MVFGKSCAESGGINGFKNESSRSLLGVISKRLPVTKVVIVPQMKAWQCISSGGDISLQVRETVGGDWVENCLMKSLQSNYSSRCYRTSLEKS